MIWHIDKNCFKDWSQSKLDHTYDFMLTINRVDMSDSWQYIIVSLSDS